MKSAGSFWGDIVDITFLVEVRGFSGIQFKYLEQ